MRTVARAYRACPAAVLRTAGAGAAPDSTAAPCARPLQWRWSGFRLRRERKAIAVRADLAVYHLASARRVGGRACNELDAVIAVLACLRLVLVLDVRL